jgi:deferrochelatase/peroxidase EfeB
MTGKAMKPSSLSRRGVLFGATAGAVGVAAHAASFAASPPQGGEDVVDLTQTHPFYGDAQQAGISTVPQRHCMFMTFDLTTAKRGDLQVLLALWSGAIAQMMQGATIGQVEPPQESAVGLDTGEALNLNPASLTVTVGLGPKVFTDIYGLSHQKPALLRELKQLPSDALDPNLTGGDLSIQACADDPQVAYHAVRDLARIAKSTGTAETRWTVMGFGRASAGRGQSTPRNLLGFKDGTRNLREDSEFEQFVWVKDGPDWQRYGSYQVVRKIQMHIENWDTDRVSDQNNVIGRHKVSGAPLTGTGEFDAPDFNKTDAKGDPVIPVTAHIALAAHENNGGIRILRRSYNYTDGLNQFGQLDAGLIFLSYQNDPGHFEALQTKLGTSDGLNEYIAHIGSGIFFVPRAPKEGSYIAQEMFA